MTIVDVHCHTFNADDVPVRGFVEMHLGDRLPSVARVVGAVLERLLQDRAPGSAEIAELDELLDGGATGLGTAVESTDISSEADVLLEELQAEQPDLIAAANEELLEADTDPGDDYARRLEGFALLRRWIGWALLFTKKRLDLTRTVAGLYPRVALFVPLSVDFPSLADGRRGGAGQTTSPHDQMRLQSKISELSMRDRGGPHVHPFIGFDPRRPGALGLAQTAVHDYGFVGVKMYPTAGFLPIGSNDEERDLLRRFYEWCTEEEVPITAHCNRSFGKRADLDNSSPAEWGRVLAEWPDLHLNLGHGGWGVPDAWPTQIARMMVTHPNLYTDVGNHQVKHVAGTVERLKAMAEDSRTAVFAERIMFGTDWYMNAGHAAYEDFLDEYRRRFSDSLPALTNALLGDSALAFLGFSDAGNKNNQRLRKRYDTKKMTPYPDWLAVP